MSKKSKIHIVREDFTTLCGKPMSCGSQFSCLLLSKKEHHEAYAKGTYAKGRQCAICTNKLFKIWTELGGNGKEEFFAVPPTGGA